MVNRSVSSRVVLAAAAVVALGFTAACGSDSGDGKNGSGGDRTAGDRAASAPLSKTALAKAALTKSEAKGYVITPMTDKEAAKGGEPKTERSECRPLAALMGSTFTPAPTASVFRTYSKTDAALGSTDDPSAGLAGMLRVSAYGQGDAERTVKELRSAVSACGDGFELTDAEGKKQRLSHVKALPDPEFGDEAVAYQADSEASSADESGGTIAFAAVRSGSHLTVAFAFNLVKPTAAEIPQELLKAQVAKVERAGKADG